MIITKGGYLFAVMNTGLACANLLTAGVDGGRFLIRLNGYFTANTK